MATIEEIKPYRLFRHKGGKLYKIEARNPDTPRWGGKVGADGRVIYDQADENYPYPVADKSKVYATQWQVNEKYPEGREYQAARELKIADLTAVK